MSINIKRNRQINFNISKHNKVVGIIIGISSRFEKKTLWNKLPTKVFGAISDINGREAALFSERYYCKKNCNDITS